MSFLLSISSVPFGCTNLSFDGARSVRLPSRSSSTKAPFSRLPWINHSLPPKSTVSLSLKPFITCPCCASFLYPPAPGFFLCICLLWHLTFLQKNHSPAGGRSPCPDMHLASAWWDFSMPYFSLCRIFLVAGQ